MFASHRLWSLLILVSLLAAGAPVVLLATAHQAMAAPEPAKNPPTPTPKPRATEVEVAVSAPQIFSIGNVDCSTVPTYTQCFKNEVAGKPAVVVLWAPCSAGNCAQSVQTIALYSKAYPNVFPAGQPQSSLALSSYSSGSNIVFFLDKFAVGDCFVTRAFTGKEALSPYSPPSSPMCVTSSTPVGQETVKVTPDAVQGRYYAHVCSFQGPMIGVSVDHVTVGVQGINSGKCPTPQGESMSYSLLVDFSQSKFNASSLIKIMLVVDGGGECARTLTEISNSWMSGNLNYATGAVHKLPGSAGFQFDITSWPLGGAYELGPDFASNKSCLPPNAPSPYLIVQKIKGV
jgi:hypothetical protein